MINLYINEKFVRLQLRVGGPKICQMKTGFVSSIFNNFLKKISLFFFLSRLKIMQPERVSLCLRLNSGCRSTWPMTLTHERTNELLRILLKRRQLITNLED